VTAEPELKTVSFAGLFPSTFPFLWTDFAQACFVFGSGEAFWRWWIHCFSMWWHMVWFQFICIRFYLHAPPTCD
jgi:hypothetical protein